MITIIIGITASLPKDKSIIIIPGGGDTGIGGKKKVKFNNINSEMYAPHFSGEINNNLKPIEQQ